MTRLCLLAPLALAACASPIPPAVDTSASVGGMHFAVTAPRVEPAGDGGAPSRRDALRGVVLSSAPPDVSGVTAQPGGPPDPLNQNADSAGPATYRDLGAPSTRTPDYVALPDGPGNLILRDQQTGEIVRAPVDPQGHAVFNDGHGRVVRCTTDPAGVTICD